MVVLAKNQTTDGDSNVYKLSSEGKNFVNGTVFVSGEAGGGTITIRMFDGIEWFDLNTVGIDSFLQINHGFQMIKANLSGSTSPRLNVTMFTDSDFDFVLEQEGV